MTMRNRATSACLRLIVYRMLYSLLFIEDEVKFKDCHAVSSGIQGLSTLSGQPLTADVSSERLQFRDYAAYCPPSC